MLDREAVQRLSDGRDASELPLWRGFPGLTGETPDLGVVPRGCIGVVFDGLGNAEWAYALLSEQGLRVAYPKAYSGVVPPWVGPALPADGRAMSATPTVAAVAGPTGRSRILE